jgi:hypothetical protein
MAKPKKYAYCIGLNYEGTPDELRGCRADAENLAAVMRGRGFDSVEAYFSQTPAEFFNSMASFAERLTPADTLVITYSGHGTQAYDPSEPREFDWYDEAICLWSAQTGIQVVKDDDIQRAISRIRGVIFFISDSCYAGGLDRMTAAPKAGHRQKFILFDPATMPVYNPALPKAEKPNPFQRVYQLFACDEQEVSWDTASGGVFTNALLKHYAAGTKSVGKLIDKCREDLRDWQTPVLAPIIRGNKSRYLF